MKLCAFDSSKKGTACKVCGGTLRRDYSTIPKRRCPSEKLEGYPIERSCSHTGDKITRDGKPVTVKIKCSSGTGRNLFLVTHKCDIFYRCIPRAYMNKKQLADWSGRHESELYALCQLCPIPENKMQYQEGPR